MDLGSGLSLQPASDKPLAHKTPGSGSGSGGVVGDADAELEFTMIDSPVRPKQSACPRARALCVCLTIVAPAARLLTCCIACA